MNIGSDDALPTYQHFRSHASFVPDLADFGINLRQLQKLLAECDYSIVGAGGLGLGDINILFNTHARHGVLPYEGVLKLCRILAPRMRAVSAHLEASPSPRQQQQHRAGSPPGRLGRASGGALLAELSNSSVVVPDRESSNGILPATMAAGPGPGSSSAQTALLRQSSVARPLSATRPQSAAVGPLRLTAIGAAAAAADAAAGGGGGMMSRPASAGPGRPASAGPGYSIASATPRGALNSLMTIRDPPLLLREQIPPPPCPFPTIASRVAGVQALYRDGEMRRVALGLRDIQRDWQEAATAAALAHTLKMEAAQAKRAARGGVDGADGGAGSGAGARVSGEISLEGRLWLLLLHGCCLMLEGKHRQARKSLGAAENLFNPNLLGLEHPYHYCIHLCAGLLHYYEQAYDAAIDKFEAARELADLVSRGTFDVTARRNAAACLNNKGVCHALLGHRPDAVACFRAAYQLVRAAEGVPEVPEAVVALRNLNKALKQSFALNVSRLNTGMRPGSAPPLRSQPLIIGSTSVPPELKLNTFLKQAVTLRPPPAPQPLPAWARKTTIAEVEAARKAREAAKKAKAKAAAASADKKKKAGTGAKKAPPFEAMTTYTAPSYSVANVKLAAAKKGRKKAAPAK